ncbi:hypothetical protein MTO96_045331, partial [Rhipicephalus appendiculatus]
SDSWGSVGNGGHGWGVVDGGGGDSWGSSVGGHWSSDSGGDWGVSHGGNSWGVVGGDGLGWRQRWRLERGQQWSQLGRGRRRMAGVATAVATGA